MLFWNQEDLVNKPECFSPPIGKTYFIVPVSKLFNTFGTETKEMLDWNLINAMYEIETLGYSKVVPNNSLYQIRNLKFNDDD